MTDRSWPAFKLGFDLSWTKVAVVVAGGFLGLGLLAACEGPMAEEVPPEALAPTDVPAGPDTEPTDHAAYPAVEEQPDVIEPGATIAVTATTVSVDEPSGLAASGEARPGDMLSAVEADRASQLALEAASGMLAAATDRDALEATADLQALAERPSYRVMYSQRHPVKEGNGRLAEVGIYRYDTNSAVLTQVDLSSGLVTPMAIEPGYMAPLVPAEIAEAARVARADDAARQALQDAGLDPDTATANGLLTTTVAGETESPCAASRCVRLFFFGPSRIVPDFHVIVDVSALRVVEIAPLVAQEESQ